MIPNLPRRSFLYRHTLSESYPQDPNDHLCTFWYTLSRHYSHRCSPIQFRFVMFLHRVLPALEDVPMDTLHLPLCNNCLLKCPSISALNSLFHDNWANIRVVARFVGQSTMDLNEMVIGYWIVIVWCLYEYRGNFGAVFGATEAVSLKKRNVNGTLLHQWRTHSSW